MTPNKTTNELKEPATSMNARKELSHRAPKLNPCRNTKDETPKTKKKEERGHPGVEKLVTEPKNAGTTPTLG